MEHRCKICGEPKLQEEMRQKTNTCKACFKATNKMPTPISKVRNRKSGVERKRWLKLWWLPESVEAYQKGIDQPYTD